MRKISDLKKWEVNPRKITESQKRILKKGVDEFGDLSGIIYNKQLDCLVGGHQRTSILDPNSEIVIEKKYDQPTDMGTVAEGYILQNGERYRYREVAWDQEKHAAAALMANQAGGDWDWSMLPKILSELEGNGYGDIELTGFDLVDVEKILGGPAETIDRKAEWEGMPEFDQDNKTYRTIFVHFLDESAIKKFEELMQQPITDKTKYIWYPQSTRDDLTKTRIVSNES